MDSNCGLNYKQDRQLQSVKKMDSGSSYSNLVKSETSSQASSRETSVSRPSIDSKDSSRTLDPYPDTTSVIQTPLNKLVNIHQMKLIVFK